MALEYAKLPNDPEELKQLLLKHAGWVEALRAEVIRLRRWRFGRSSEVIDMSVAPELPLSGGAVPTTPVPQISAEAARPPRLVAEDAPRGERVTRRPPRMLPPELPRVIREHAPASCNCPNCGETAARLYSVIGTCRLNGIDPHLYLRHMLERIATHPINRIEELLPWRVGPLQPFVLSRAA